MFKGKPTSTSPGALLALRELVQIEKQRLLVEQKRLAVTAQQAELVTLWGEQIQQSEAYRRLFPGSSLVPGAKVAAGPSERKGKAKKAPAGASERRFCATCRSRKTPMGQDPCQNCHNYEYWEAE